MQLLTPSAQAVHIRTLAMGLAVLGLLANCYGQAVEQLLKTFGSAADGYPYAGLAQGRDGAFYGTTANGGTFNQGTVFKLNADGTAYSTLHSFTGKDGDGSNPQAPLMQGRDGALYGTTSGGGTFGHGMVFKVNTDGTGFTNFHSFGATGGDGHVPYAGLVQGSDGAFYGTTTFGGTFDEGTVYRLLMPPFKLQIARLGDCNVGLSTLTVPNATLQLDSSTNLLDWRALTNITGLTGTVQFNDLNATNYPRRFYRALWVQ